MIEHGWWRYALIWRYMVSHHETTYGLIQDPIPICVIEYGWWKYALIWWYMVSHHETTHGQDQGPIPICAIQYGWWRYALIRWYMVSHHEITHGPSQDPIPICVISKFFQDLIVNVHNFQNQRDIRMAEVAESLPPGDFRWFQSSDKKWQRNPHPNKLFAVELSQLFEEQLHISVEFQVRAKLKWSKIMLTLIPMSRKKTKLKLVKKNYFSFYQHRGISASPDW